MNIVKFIVHGTAGLIGMVVLIVAAYMLAGTMVLAEWLKKVKEGDNGKQLQKEDTY